MTPSDSHTHTLLLKEAAQGTPDLQSHSDKPELCSVTLKGQVQGVGRVSWWQKGKRAEGEGETGQMPRRISRVQGRPKVLECSPRAITWNQCPIKPNGCLKYHQPGKVWELERAFIPPRDCG